MTASRRRFRRGRCRGVPGLEALIEADPASLGQPLLFIVVHRPAAARTRPTSTVYVGAGGRARQTDVSRTDRQSGMYSVSITRWQTVASLVL